MESVFFFAQYIYILIMVISKRTKRACLHVYRELRFPGMQIENWTIECVAEQCAWQQLTSKRSGHQPFGGDQVSLLTRTCTYLDKPMRKVKVAICSHKAKGDCPFDLKPYV